MSVLTARRPLDHTQRASPSNSPEYPQRPAAHLNRPTAMRISGRTSHCETEPLVGQRNAARGKEGARTRTSDLDIWVPSPSPALPLRRGLCWPLEGVPAIVVWSSRVDQMHIYSVRCRCLNGVFLVRGGGGKLSSSSSSSWRVGVGSFIREISRSCPQPTTVELGYLLTYCP